MYVCLCNGVTEKDIQQAIAQGASSVEEVMRRTGAGTGCGTCCATIAAMVEAAVEAPRPRMGAGLRELFPSVHLHAGDPRS